MTTPDPAAPYVVFEDLDDATETKIHLASCPKYLRRKIGPTTVQWHGPFATVQEAVAVAARAAATKRHDYRRADCCLS